MPLLGTGFLAIWNNIAPEAESEFVEWHVREHIPERVGLPGFRRGRRYVAEVGWPKYFNFYETDSPADLSAPAYTDRLNNPTDWTRRVVAHFRDTSRTVCTVSASVGIGNGAFISAIQLAPATESTMFKDAMIRQILPATIESAGIVGVHLLEGHRPATSLATAESKLRSAPDSTISWLLLVEAVQLDSIVLAERTACSPGNLAKAGAPEDYVRRGVYRVQYALSAEELRSGNTAR